MDQDTQHGITDANHLEYLRWGYLIYAALNASFAVFGLVLGVMGFTQASSPMPEVDSQLHEASRAAAVVTGILTILIAGAFAVLCLRVASAVEKRTKRTFCIVIAVLTMFNFPFGTVLGLLTLLVLERPSVKRLFDAGSGAALAQPEQPAL